MPNPLSTWWSIGPLRTSNAIVRRQRWQKIAKLQTWSNWAPSGRNSWCNNHHPTKHPSAAMTRMWWRQHRTAKARWKRHVIEREYPGKTRRDAVVGTAVEHHQRHRAVLCHNIAANIVQGEAAAGSRINRTSTLLTVRIAKSLAAMDLPTRLHKVYRIQNATTTISGRVGYQNGSVKRLVSPTRNMTTDMNDGMGTWTRSIARKMDKSN